MMRKTLTVAGAALALAGAPAQAACWSPQDVAAAKIRDFDSMLMVSALRCRFENAALLDRYNGVVARHRAVLTEANYRLKAHFAQGVSARDGANALDSYITRVANRYGGGSDGLSCESLVSIAEAAIAEPADFAALAAVADRAAVVPDLPDGACPMEIAAVAMVSAR